MSKVNKFLEIVAEILEVEVNEISLKTELNDACWDSLAVVTFISEIDSEFDVLVSPQKVGAVESIQDLFELL
jgi:acyl carrier protein